VSKAKKSMKEHVDTVVDQLPDKKEWAAMRDELIERLPDKDELLEMRDGLVDKLPDEVSGKLPIDQPKKKRFRRTRKVAFWGLVTAAVAGAVAFAKSKMAEKPTYTSSTYTPPGTPTGRPTSV